MAVCMAARTSIISELDGFARDQDFGGQRIPVAIGLQRNCRLVADRFKNVSEHSQALGAETAGRMPDDSLFKAKGPVHGALLPGMSMRRGKLYKSNFTKV